MASFPAPASQPALPAASTLQGLVLGIGTIDRRTSLAAAMLGAFILPVTVALLARRLMRRKRWTRLTKDEATANKRAMKETRVAEESNGGAGREAGDPWSKFERAEEEEEHQRA